MKITVKMYSQYQKAIFEGAEIINGQPKINLGNEVDAKNKLLADACGISLEELEEWDIDQYNKKLKELDKMLNSSKKG